LQHLESHVRRVSPPEDQGDFREEDWLKCFTAWGAAGRFAREPDFPEALAGLGTALARAQAQTDPPFDPPPDFRPDLAVRQRWRLWREHASFADVHAHRWWLMTMLRRVQQGTPPVSAAEFDELARWFAAHHSDLYEWSQPSQLLDAGPGYVTSVANLRYHVQKGVRDMGAGKWAEALCRLRARYDSAAVGNGNVALVL
jgi:hypothetical protein